ncbi:response regulator [Neoaquamicrobium microcysteis]|uniref:response regulator n=1 Tax=Neoaquamicrobium microcysteis TaxID=2682781 RepID=UPI001F38C746|nr:response regulator transcription factor [Mesorhizobium microcysteis]
MASDRQTIRLVVVDDHPIYRSGVIATLRDYDDIAVVGQGASASDAIELMRTARPDVALLDISMPGNGVAAVGAILAEKPDARVVMLTVSEDDDDVMNALKNGAAGYALKGIGGDDLIAIIRDIHAGETYVSPKLAGRLLKQGQSRAGHGPGDALDLLSPRERGVLDLLSDGLSNKEIGLRLGLQEKTVKHHMTQIMQKLRVRNRVEAAVFARLRRERLGP